MIVIIQCADKKKPGAGFMQRKDGRKISFVADPVLAPTTTDRAYAHPDDISDSGKSWRDELLSYNESPADNPLELLPAWQLYKNRTYGMLVEKYGVEHVYILSAGWGLISAEFLTPVYDITFSTKAEKYKRRRKRDQYSDLRMLPRDADEPIVFFVSKEYVALASKLTERIEGTRYLFYNSSIIPDAPGCRLERYVTRTRTNWQYGCAKAFMDGEIGV